ncbi:MAG: hypothetical protein DMF04_05495, partial [Verrucomicrobia bacterium]
MENGVFGRAFLFIEQQLTNGRYRPEGRSVNQIIQELNSIAKLRGDVWIRCNIFLEGPLINITICVLRWHVNAADALEAKSFALPNDFTGALAAHKFEQCPGGFFLPRARWNSVTPAANPTMAAILLPAGTDGQWRNGDCVIQVLTILREHFWKNPVAVDL